MSCWKKWVVVALIIAFLIPNLLHTTNYTNIKTNTSLKIRPWQDSNTQYLHDGKTNETPGDNDKYKDVYPGDNASWPMENPFTEDRNISYIVSRLYMEPHFGSDIRVDGSIGDMAAFNISFGDVNHDHIADLIVGAPYADWPSNVSAVYDEESQGKSSYPFNADMTWVRLQMLYLKSDIPTTGIIDKIYFYKTTSGKTGVFKNFRIYLGDYPSNSLGENLDDNNNSAINEKLVYKADEFTLSGDAGWFSIDVYNIFNYTGNNNLFIQISWAGSSGDTLYLKEKDRGGNYYRAYAASGTYSNSSAKRDALQYWMKLAITPWQKADCGATYIFFGYKNWSASHLTTEDANWTLYGEMGHDHFGWAVDTLDFNGDWSTRDDVIIGAPNGSVGQIRPGKMYIFYGGRFDEFENFTPLQGWSYSSTGVTVTATKSYKGSQSLRFYDSGTTVEKYAYRSIPNYDAGIVELFVNLNWTGGNFFITLKSGASDVMKIEFGNDGFIYYYDSTGSYQLMSEGYAPNTWYWVKFDYDCGRGTYDVYLNNTLVKSGIDFINSASSIDTIDLRTGKSTKVKVYVDQVVTAPGYVIGVGEFDGDKYGFSVSYAGDTNYDGVDDAVVGAPGYQNNTGKSYVYFGKEATNSKSLTPTETYENSSNSNVNQNPSSLSTVKSSHNTKSVFRKKSKDDCDKKVDFLKQYESVYGRYYREGEEVMEYRTPFSRTFRMPDGTYVTILSGIATSYKDENGNWHDIDWNNPPPNIKEKLKGENDYDKYSFWYGYGYDIDFDGDDAHVYNFQSDGTYQSSSYPIMIGTDKDGRKEWSRGWIQWDTSSIPDYAHPFQVRIRLYVAYVGQWDDEWDTHAVNLEFIQMTNKPSDQGEHDGDIDNYWLYDDAADGTLYWGTHGNVSFSTAGSAHYVRVTMDPNYDTWYPSSTGWVDLGYDACDDLYNHLSSDWWAVGLHQMNEEGDDRDAWPGDPDPGEEHDEGIELFGADQYLEVRWYVPNFEDDLEPAPLDYWETSSSFAILEPWEAEDFEPQRSGAFDWWSTSGAEQVSQTATGLSAFEGSYMAHLKYDKNNADYYMKINNPIDLTHTSSATLVFYYTGSSESDYDLFYFKISTDGNNWVNLLTRSGDYSDGWYLFSYDLAANGYTGNKIYVKFEFVTDGSNYGSSYGEGWYIDLFYVTCDNFWHLTTNDYHSSSHSYYFGVDSIGKYTNYSIQALFTPDIYLSTSADHVTLSFWEKYDTQSSADYCEVWLHDYYDDSSHRLTYYSGSSGGWKERIIDLTSYKGHTVYIYFIFSSGPSGIYSGWWIDDIRIYGTYRITFKAWTHNSGSHTNLSSSNYVTVTYYRCGWQHTVNIWDNNPAIVYVDAGSTYTYSLESSGSDDSGGHRWYLKEDQSGTATASTTITKYYYEQYYITVTIRTTNSGPHTNLDSSSNSITVGYVYLGDLYSIEMGDDNSPQSGWLDAGNSLTFDQQSSGSTQTHRWITNEDTSVTITSSFSITRNYYEQWYISYSVTHSTNSGSISGTVRDTYTYFGSVTTKDLNDGSTGNQWVDCGSYVYFSGVSSGTAAYRWDFNKDGDAEGWSAVNNIASFSASGGKLNVQSSGTDPFIHSPSGLSIDASTYKYVIVRMKINPAGSGPYDSKLYFITSTDSTYNEAKSKLADYSYTDGNYYIFTFNMSSVSGWTGTVTQIRLDPLDAGAASGDWYYIDYVAVVKSHIWTLQSPTDSVQRWYVDSAISITATYYEMYYPKVQTSGLDSGGSYGTYVHRTLTGTSTDSEYKIYDEKVWYGWCDANTSISVDQIVNGASGERWDCQYPTLTSSLQNSGTYTAHYYHQYQITFKAWTKNTGSHTNMSLGNTATVWYKFCGNLQKAYPYDNNPVQVWVDAGDASGNYSYSSTSTGSTSTHRWYSPNPPSGTVSGPATITGYYWEQYAVTFEYAKGNGADCTHTLPPIPVNVTSCGLPIQWMVNTSMHWSLWVDNGSNYEYWNPYVIVSGNDFEDGTLDGWNTNTPGSTSISVDSTHSISGSYSVKFSDTDSSNGAYMFKQFTTISNRKGVILFYIYKSNTNQYFDLTVKNGGATRTQVMEVDFRSDGYVYYYDGTTDYNSATKWFKYSANTWYLVYFIFDESSKKYDIYIFQPSAGHLWGVIGVNFMNKDIYSFDTLKFTTGAASSNVQTWVDDVYVGVFDNSLSNERWYSADSLRSGIITKSETINPTYYHQWKVTFKYSVGNVNCTATPPHITVWYYHEGSLDKSGYATTSGQAYWVDCGSNYNYTNPYPYSPTTERWYSRDTISGQITSSITINPTYYHQWKITFGVISHGSDLLSSTNYAILTYKANNSWTSEHIWSQDQISRWVDCGEDVKFSEKSSGSTSTQRWFNPVPREFKIDENYHPGSINEEYWEQWYIAITAHVVNSGHGENSSLTSSNYSTVTYYWCSGQNTTHVWDGHYENVWVNDGSGTITFSSTSSGSTSNHRWYAPVTFYNANENTQQSGVDCVYYEQYLASLSTHTLPSGAPSLNSNNYATAWITANGTNESVSPIYDDISPVDRWVDNNTYVIFKQIIYDSSNNIRWVAEDPWRHQVTSLSTRTIPQNYWCQYKNVVGVYIINDASTFPNDVEIKYYQTNQLKYLYLGNGKRKEWTEIWADYNSQITWQEEPYNNSQERWRIDDDAVNPETVTSYGNNWTKYYYHQYYIEFRTPKNVGSCSHTPPAFSLTTRWNLGDNDGGQSGNSYWVDNNTRYEYENPHDVSSNERWYISSSNYSALVDGSYFIVQPDAYHQWKILFKYRKMNNNCPHIVNIPFNYTYLGEKKVGYASEDGNTYWVDCESSYDYYNPYHDSSTSRWISSSSNFTGQITTDIITAGKIEPYYYHQLKVNFIPKKGNGAGCGHSLPDASNFKLNYTLDGTRYVNQRFGEYWVDCGSTVEYQPYYNSTIDRWYPESLSETITSGGDHYVKFFHQWKITFSAVTINAGTKMDENNYVDVSYTMSNNSKNVHVWDGHDGIVWADCGSQFIYSQESSASTSHHRWRTNEALTGTVSYSTANSGVSKNYYEQVYLTLDNGGHDTGYSEGELFGSSHSAFGPGSSWYDVGCTVIIRVDSPVGGDWIRYRFDHWTGRYTSNSNPYSFTMPSADGVSETAVWITQYKLAVKTQGVSPPNYTAVYINGAQEGCANDNSPFYKWYDAGSSTGTIGVDDYVGGYYIRSYFDHWIENDGSNGGSNNPHASFTMDSPYNLTAVYVEKYRLIVSTSGLPSSFPTKLWINGVYITTIYDGHSYSTWYDVGASTGNITVQEVIVTGGRFDYHFVYWNDWTTNHDHPSITMNSPVTLIAKYIMGIMFNVTIVGINEGDYFGWAVSDAGNVNETHTQQSIKDDIIIGSPGWNNWQGRVYIFYGSFLKWKANQQNKSIYLRDTNANVTLVGENKGDKFGWSVSYAGDLNGDGYDDVIIGAPGYDNNRGRSYVYYGNANMDNGGSSKKERKITLMREKDKITISIVNPNNDEVAGSYAKKLVEEYSYEIDESTKNRLKGWIDTVKGREVGEITLPNVEKYFHKKMRDIIKNGKRPIYRIELLNESVFREDWMNLSMDDRRNAMISFVKNLDALKQERNATRSYKDNWYNPREILTLEYLAHEVYENPENWKIAYEIIKGVKSIDDARIGPFEAMYHKGRDDSLHHVKSGDGGTVTLQIIHFHEESYADKYAIGSYRNGDPYFVLGVGDWYLTTGDVSNDGTFNCKFIHTNSNVSGSTVSIHIEAWDSDSDTDDHYDISPISNDNDVDVTYDLTTKTWSGDVSNPYSYGNGDSDGDGGQVDGDIWFVIESDEDNEAKLGDYDPNYDSEPYHDGECFNDPYDSPTRVTYYSGNNYWSTFPQGVHFSYEEYEFYVSSGTTISVHMVPDDSDDNFDLYLYDPSGNQKASSTNGAGSQEDISYTADSSGYWKIRITNVSVDNDGDEWFRFWFTSGPDDKNYLSVATQGSGYDGYLISTYNGKGYYDPDDYYKIYVSSWQISHGASIYIYMKPNNNADFNLYLYDPNGNLTGSSTNTGNGKYESVLYDLQSTDTSGYWYFKVDIASGYGNYSLFVWFGFRVEFYAITANSGPHEFMHSDNGVRVSYVRMGLMDYVYPNDDYYWIVYVDNGSSYSYASQSNLSGTTHRWYSNAPPNGTISSSTSITGYYYEQYNITVNAQKGNGAGCTDTLPTSNLHYSYYSFGTQYSNGNYGSATWIDNGSEVQALDYSVSSTQRWACDPNDNSVTVTSGNSITFTYYHQWWVEFKIIIKSPDGNEPTGGIDVHYTQFGSGKSQGATKTGFSDWVDCGSSYYYDNPSHLTQNMERWFSPSANVSGSITSDITVAPFYYHQYWVTIKFTIGNDAHCTHSTAIPVSWKYLGNTNNSYAYTRAMSTWVDGGSQVVYENPYVITTNAERWFSNDNPSGNVEYTISSAQTCNPTYWHQWYITAETTGGYLDSTHSTTLYYNQTGTTHTTSIYDSSPWQGWVDCGSQLKVDTPVSGPTSPRNVHYVCDFPLAYVTINGTYSFLFHAEFPADVDIDGGKQGDEFGYAVDGSIVINGSISIVIGAPGNNTVYVFCGNDSWSIGLNLHVWDSFDSYTGEHAGDRYGFSVIGRDADFNDDGTYDIAVGAPLYNSMFDDYRGRAYILRIGYPNANISLWYKDPDNKWHLIDYYILENLNAAGWHNHTWYVNKQIPSGSILSINVDTYCSYGSPFIRVYYNSTAHNSNYEIKATMLDNNHVVGTARTVWVKTYWLDGNPTNLWIPKYSKSQNGTSSFTMFKARVEVVKGYDHRMIAGARIKIVNMDDGTVVVDNESMKVDYVGDTYIIFRYNTSLDIFSENHQYIVIVTAVDADGFDDWEFGIADERTARFYVLD